MQETSKRENNKVEKKQSLLDSAYALFTSKGSKNTTILDITKLAHVGKGTFYLYFKDKMHIKEKLIVYKSSIVIKEAFETLEKENYTEASDKMIALFDYMIDYLSVHVELLKLIHKNLSVALYKEVLFQRDIEGEENMIKKLVMEFQKEFQSKFSPEEGLITLFIIIEMVGSSIYSSIIDGEPVPIEVLKPPLYRGIRKILD